MTVFSNLVVLVQEQFRGVLTFNLMKFEMLRLYVTKVGIKVVSVTKWLTLSLLLGLPYYSKLFRNSF